MTKKYVIVKNGYIAILLLCFKKTNILLFVPASRFEVDNIALIVICQLCVFCKSVKMINLS